MFYKSIVGATCVCVAALSFNAEAALIGRLPSTPGGTDYQAYYDNAAGLTWLADANYAKTSSFDTDGLMTWQVASDWVAQLTVGGVGGWRLADTLQPDASCSSQSGSSSGFNCTGSEMGNLHYNTLGNTAGLLPNTGPFKNVQLATYWSATTFAPSTDAAWSFGMSGGFQAAFSKTTDFYSWAVQSGDVVPVPAAVWLFSSGLLGLAGIARRGKVYRVNNNSGWQYQG